MGISPKHVDSIIDHRVWSDGEYLCTFATKKCLDNEGKHLLRFLANYRESVSQINDKSHGKHDGPHGKNESQEKIVYGNGLKGKTIYIVHTLSRNLSPQDLETRLCCIADTAKYNGAEAVVLIAYTLDHSAQERGVWDTGHPRMQTDKALLKFDGQAPLSRTLIKNYLVSGIDAIVTPQNHCPEDTKRIIEDVNEEFRPMRNAASKAKSTMRYSLKFVHVNLAPLYGYYISDYGEKNLSLDISGKGKNICFIAPDQGILPHVKEVRQYSGLTNSALASVIKSRAASGDIDNLSLGYVEGLNEERGLQDMHLVWLDDAIRSGETAAVNFNAFSGIDEPRYRGKTLVIDPRLKGRPKRNAFIATRTNFAGESIRILSTPSLDDLVITNADPRGVSNLGILDEKTQVLWINFVMAEAAKALETGSDPNESLTPNNIRDGELLKIYIPHGHKTLVSHEEHKGLIV